MYVTASVYPIYDICISIYCFFKLFKAPINDYQAASGLIGLRPSTKNAHIVRAVLESIVFRVAQLYDCTLNETKFKFSVIR